MTGASGFIGQHLMGALEDAGRVVPVPVAGPRSSGGWDMRDSRAVDDFVRECEPDAAIHLGGFAAASPHLDLAAETAETNVLGTVNLLAALERTRCRVVLCVGSLEQSGFEQTGKMTSPYLASKVAAGAYCRLFDQVSDLRVIEVRIAMAYGPGQQPQRLVPALATSLTQQGQAELLMPGRKIDLIYVSDVIAGLIAVLSTWEVAPDVVEFGSGTATTVLEVAGLIARLLEYPPAAITVATNPPPDGNPLVARLSRNSGLAWQPTVSLQTGVTRTLNSLGMATRL